MNVGVALMIVCITASAVTRSIAVSVDKSGVGIPITIPIILIILITILQQPQPFPLEPPMMQKLAHTHTVNQENKNRRKTLDETKDNAQDSPPPSVTDKVGQASGDEKGSTSEPETFTKADVEKARSDALSEKGREVKTVSDQLKSTSTERDSLQQKLEGQRTVVDDLQKRIDDLEERAAGDDPDLKAAYKQKRQAELKLSDISRREDAVAKREEQAKSNLEAANAAKLEVTISKLSTKYGVNEDWLSGLKVSDPEALEQIAEKAGKKVEASEKKKEALKADSGETVGGNVMPDKAKDKIRSGWDELHKNK